MSTTTRPPSGRRPALPGATDEPPSRARGALSLLGSLLLLLGVPVALIFLVGNPLPTSLPSRDWLTAQVTPWLVIEILAVLLWVVWIHFVVCFLTEWRAIRAGRMPENVVMGGGSQLLARRLVAGILLLAGGASTAHGIGTAMAAEAPAPTHVQTSSLSAFAGAGGEQGNAESGPSLEKSGGQQQGKKAAAPAKMTTVKPPEGRHHDTAWGIAERTLGDGLRYKEIFDLNRDRLMPDGRRFTDADLIQPGWQLFLPADAQGPDVHVVHDGGPGPGTSAPTPMPHDSGDSKGSGSAGPEAGSDVGESSLSALGGDLGGDPTDRTGAETRQMRADFDDERTSVRAVDGTQDTESGFAGLGSMLLGGGLILAGVARALTAKRGPFGDPEPSSTAVNSAANLVRAEFLDLALRSLAVQREREGLPLPEVRSAYLNDDTLVLHLTGDCAPPEAPWAKTDEQAWTVYRKDVGPVTVDVAAPYPSLVNVAETHGFDVLVDLEVAPGPISLAGNAEVARDLATAMALDLGTHTWSDEVAVFMVGFGDHLVDIDTGRARVVADVEQVIAALGAEAREQESVLARLGVQGVLQGRQRGAIAECAPAVAFLSGPPTPEQTQRLAALTASGRTSLSVVCVGDSPSARWRFLVDEQGAFEAAALGLTGTARRFDPAAQQQLRRLLEQAKRERAAAAPEFADSSPSAAAAAVTVAVPGASDGPDRPDPGAALAAAPVRVRMLGQVEVLGLAPVADVRRKAMLTETVVMAALHPDGLHDAVLRASLWPRGVDDDVVAARVNDVAAWLGLDAAGRPRLYQGDDGRLHLSPEVHTDYGVLATVARTPAADPAAELDGLLAALRLGTGEAFSGDGRRYSWLAFAQESRRGRLLIATVSRRAAELASYLRRPAEAAEALELGLRLVPASEELWRLLLRLRAQHDPDRVESTIDALMGGLRARGASPEPETSAIVIELSPQREQGVVS